MLPRFLPFLPIAGRQEFFEVFEVHPGRKILFKEIQEAAGSGIRRQVGFQGFEGRCERCNRIRFEEPFVPTEKRLLRAGRAVQCPAKGIEFLVGTRFTRRLTPCFPIGISACFVSSQITPCFRVRDFQQHRTRFVGLRGAENSRNLTLQRALPQNSFFFKNRSSSTASVPLSKILADSFARVSCSGTPAFPLGLSSSQRCFNRSSSFIRSTGGFSDRVLAMLSISESPCAGLGFRAVAGGGCGIAIPAGEAAGRVK